MKQIILKGFGEVVSWAVIIGFCVAIFAAGYFIGADNMRTHLDMQINAVGLCYCTEELDL